MKSMKRIARLFTGLFICTFLSGITGLNGQVPDGIYLLELSIPGQREVLTISVII